MSGVKCQPSAGKKTAGLIEKETLKKRISNIEQRIANIEVRYSIIIIFEKRLSAAIPHFIISVITPADSILTVRLIWRIALD